MSNGTCLNNLQSRLPYVWWSFYFQVGSKLEWSELGSYDAVSEVADREACRLCQKNFSPEFSSGQWDSHSFLNQFSPQKCLGPSHNIFLYGIAIPYFSITIPWRKILSEGSKNIFGTNWFKKEWESLWSLGNSRKKFFLTQPTGRLSKSMLILRLKTLVIVIHGPEIGLAGGASPILLLVWHWLYIIICEGCRLQIYSWCHTKRRGLTHQSLFWYDNDKDF